VQILNLVVIFRMGPDGIFYRGVWCWFYFYALGLLFRGSVLENFMPVI